MRSGRALYTNIDRFPPLFYRKGTIEGAFTGWQE
jgi:hypothetical protein